MKYISFLIIFLFLTVHIHGQSKQDYVWLTDNGVGKKQMYFNSGTLVFETDSDMLGVFSNNASICDPDGNLILYSNGCAIANKWHDIIENGDSINVEAQYINEDPDCDSGKGGFQDILLLPDPAKDSCYYLIHKPSHFYNFSKTGYGHVLYSYIDMTENNGEGKVLRKNILVLEHDFLQLSYLTAIAHENQTDWWIIQPAQDTNLYFTFLLDSAGLNLVYEDYLGEARHFDASASGTAKFSPDGTKYAFFNYAEQLQVYDFDRATGKLSNHKKIVIDPNLEQAFGSVEWSSNSRFIYCASSFFLHQVDTWQEDEVLLISTWDNFFDPFPNVYFYMILGPDCRIYTRATSSTSTWHIMHYPNEKGEACGFVEGGLDIPGLGGFGNWPNHPRFRVDEAEKCDPSIISVLGKPVYYTESLVLYPNPSSDWVRFEIPSGYHSGTVYMYNSSGKELLSRDITHETTVNIQLSGYQDGLYYIEFLPANNTKRKLYQGTLVVNGK